MNFASHYYPSGKRMRSWEKPGAWETLGRGVKVKESLINSGAPLSINGKR